MGGRGEGGRGAGRARGGGGGGAMQAGGGRGYVMIQSGRGAFSAHSFLDCKSGGLKMPENRAAGISSSSSLRCNHPGGFKAASVLLRLLFLRVDSPAGKFHAGLSWSRSAVWSDGSCGWRRLGARPRGRDSWISPSEISEPFMQSVLKGGPISPMATQGS